MVTVTHYTLRVALIVLDRLNTINMSIDQDIDNRWIVSHNKLLLWSMNCNCNVEFCMLLKYALQDMTKQCSLYSPSMWLKSLMQCTLAKQHLTKLQLYRYITHRHIKIHNLKNIKSLVDLVNFWRICIGTPKTGLSLTLKGVCSKYGKFPWQK